MRVNRAIELNRDRPRKLYKSRAGVGERPVKISDIRKMKVVS